MCLLIVSPLSRGLFHRAIAESGAFRTIQSALRLPGTRDGARYLERWCPGVTIHVRLRRRGLGDAFGAFHGSEIRIFGTPLLGLPLTPDAQPLLATMTGYWAGFATTGDPNDGDAPPWPGYTVSDEQHIVIDVAAITTGAHLKQAKCDFWDAFAAAVSAP